MNPLRILFVSPYVPSLIRVRPYNIIKHLAQRGHQITLLALVPPGEDTSSLNSLQEWCHQVKTVPLPRWQTLTNGLGALASQIPFQAAYSRSFSMTSLIRQTQAQADFDVAHVEHLRGSELSWALSDIPIVFDSVDSIALLFERVLQSGPTWRSRLLAKIDLGRTQLYEGQLLERYARVLVTSPQDKNSLAELSTTQRIDDRLLVLPNGVDLDYFSPLNVRREAATIVFTGKMSYHANIAAAMDLATQVMPLVWQQIPTAQLVLAGKDPSTSLVALAADPRITVTGTVPDLRPYLAKATVAVTPIRYGVGIQNKVLEAMAMATPVVSTPQAVVALQAQPEENLLVASTHQAMAEAVLALLKNRPLQKRLGQAGRCYVETHHDWNAIAEKLERIYQGTNPRKL